MTLIQRAELLREEAETRLRESEHGRKDKHSLSKGGLNQLITFGVGMVGVTRLQRLLRSPLAPLPPPLWLTSLCRAAARSPTFLGLSSSCSGTGT